MNTSNKRQRITAYNEPISLPQIIAHGVEESLWYQKCDIKIFDNNLNVIKMLSDTPIFDLTRYIYVTEYDYLKLIISICNTSTLSYQSHVYIKAYTIIFISAMHWWRSLLFVSKDFNKAIMPMFKKMKKLYRFMITLVIIRSSGIRLYPTLNVDNIHNPKELMKEKKKYIEMYLE